MSAATRLNDNCSGHDACASVPLITGSDNVRVNGLPAGRRGDIYQSHSCDEHGAHSDVIVGGSASVRINGRPAARVGDAVSLGGMVAEGSGNVRIGD